MRLGGDTGLPIGVIEQSEAALTHWRAMLAGDDELVMSTLTICELLTHYYKRGKGDTARELAEQLRLLGNAEFGQVDDRIAERAAGYRHGLGIPTVDAVILSTFVERKCALVVSADRHFEIAADRGVADVELLT